MGYMEYMDRKANEFKAFDEADKVNAAFLKANRVLDTVKEQIINKHGMPVTGEWIHTIAHEALTRLDLFGDILHTMHFTQTYPKTDAFTEETSDVGRCLEITAEIIDEVDKTLNDFIIATSGTAFNAMSVDAENIQTANASDRAKVLQAWRMWENEGSVRSFENWVSHLIGG